MPLDSRMPNTAFAVYLARTEQEKIAAKEKEQPSNDPRGAIYLDAPPITTKAVVDFALTGRGWRLATDAAKEEAARMEYERAHADDLVAIPEPIFEEEM